jgi:hypothetical protein
MPSILFEQHLFKDAFKTSKFADSDAPLSEQCDINQTIEILKAISESVSPLEELSDTMERFAICRSLQRRLKQDHAVTLHSLLVLVASRWRRSRLATNSRKLVRRLAFQDQHMVFENLVPHVLPMLERPRHSSRQFSAGPTITCRRCTHVRLI